MNSPGYSLSEYLISFLALAKTFKTFYLCTYFVSTSLTRNSVLNGGQLCPRCLVRYLPLLLERIPSSTAAMLGTSWALNGSHTDAGTN